MLPKTIKPVKIYNRIVTGHYDINLSGWCQHNGKWYYFSILIEDTLPGGSDVLLYGLYEVPYEVMLAAKGHRRAFQRMMYKGVPYINKNKYKPYRLRSDSFNGIEKKSKLVGYCKIYGQGYDGKTRPHRVRWRTSKRWNKVFSIRFQKRFRGYTAFYVHPKPLKTRAFTEMHSESIVDDLIDLYLGRDSPLHCHDESIIRVAENHPKAFKLHFKTIAKDL